MRPTFDRGRKSVCLRLHPLWTLCLGVVLGAVPTPQPASAAVMFDGPVEFDVVLDAPRIDRLIANLPLRKTNKTVAIEADLRFNSRGRIVCADRCTVDGVPVIVKGAVKKRGGVWHYKVVMKSTFRPRTVVKVAGRFGAGAANIFYSGPKGKETVKNASVVISPPLGPVVAQLKLFPSVSARGKITGSGEFSVGYGSDDKRVGKLRGKIVGSLLKWRLRAGRKKLVFQGFSQGNDAYRGTLKVVMPPEKRVSYDFNFPETVEFIPTPVRGIEKQIPFVLRFTFGLTERGTQDSRPIRPGDPDGPKSSDFRILEDGVLIDAEETNQFLSSTDEKLINIVLVLDYSASMDQDNIDDMKRATEDFIRAQSQNTTLAVVAFWERQGGRDIIADFTRADDHSDDNQMPALVKAIGDFDVSRDEAGASEIWDSVDFALDMLPEPLEGVSQAVIFLSDGHDTSSMTNVDNVISKARTNSVTIYPLGFDLRKNFPQDASDLIRIAEKTGGEHFFDDEDLAELFVLVKDKLVGEWVLTYVTLKNSGRLVVHVDSLSPKFDLHNSHSFEIDDDLVGDIRKGLLTVEPPVQSSGTKSYILHATYVPRAIDRFRFRFNAGGATVTPRLPADVGLTLQSAGWELAREGDASDWWTVTQATGVSLKYGSRGTILSITVEGINDLVVEVDNEIYGRGESDSTPGEGKFFVFSETDSTRLAVRPRP